MFTAYISNILYIVGHYSLIISTQKVCRILSKSLGNWTRLLALLTTNFSRCTDDYRANKATFNNIVSNPISLLSSLASLLFLSHINQC